jgi:hypothetical protein
MSSKFGLHHLGQPTEATKALERGAPFAWRKQCSPGGNNPTPNIKTIGRSLKLTDGQANAMIAKGAAGAEEWYNIVRGEMLAAPWVWCWEGPNEPVVGTRQECINLSNFTHRMVDLMRGDGLKVGTGVFSVGRPQLAAANPAECFLKELQPCFDYGDYLVLHQYWLKNPTQEAEWRQFRHRLLLKELRVLGITCQPILITEAGCDNPGTGGWIASGISTVGYWAQLRDNDLALEPDNEVLCWCPFTNQPTHEWEPYVITSWLTAKICDEVRARPPEQGVIIVPEETIKLVSPIRTNPIVTQEFGANPAYYIPLGYPGHNGRDYRAPEGTPIRATHDGTVYVGRPTSPYSASYGVFCWVKGEFQGKTFWTLYGHCSRILAENLEVVPAGAIIALSGYTGRCEPPGPAGSHLHLGLETLDTNPGYRDGFDKTFYWQNPYTFMQM